MTRIGRRAVQQHGNLQWSVLCTTLWRWDALLHTNCAHSPGPELRMAMITPTHAAFTRLCRRLKLPAARPEQQVDGDDRELHNRDAPSFPPMIPIISHQSLLARFLVSIFVHLGWNQQIQMCCDSQAEFNGFNVFSRLIIKSRLLL